MTKWTKADIDELLERRPLDMREPDFWASKAARMSLYLAAGLTAEGEPKPKPERVRCRMIVYPSGNWTIFSREDGFCSDPPDGQYVGGRAIPGTFVPDGAA